MQTKFIIMSKTNENFENQEEIHKFMNGITDYTPFNRNTMNKLLRALENKEMYDEIEKLISLFITNRVQEFHSDLVAKGIIILNNNHRNVFEIFRLLIDNNRNIQSFINLIQDTLDHCYLLKTNLNECFYLIISIDKCQDNSLSTSFWLKNIISLIRLHRIDLVDDLLITYPLKVNFIFKLVYYF